MFTQEESIALSNLLFPEVTSSVADIRAKYPARTVPVVTRFAPSPTGFLHIGGLYATLISEHYAHQNGGIFMLRIEDTDKKREKEDGVSEIFEGLESFSVKIDESARHGGDYGSYIQSERKDIYAVFAKDLVARNMAYPCFLTEEEMNSIREEQAQIGLPPGMYGNFSPWAKESFEAIEEKIKSGTPYVLRLRCHGNLHKRVTVIDEIRGKIEMLDNYLDVVVLKTDGIPTYHFAHAVDDYLMGTTHVTRGEEWLPSLPLHLQLFTAIQAPAPKYAHIAPLMKTEDGNKRKLSKRKDPEANVTYFFERGYPVNAIKDYLFNIVDSNFEKWREENRDADYSLFPIDFGRMPKAGALFDLKKLESISHGYLSQLSNESLFDSMKTWASQYDTELIALINKYEALSFAAISIQRGTDRDPKKFRIFSDARPYLTQFIPELYQSMILDVAKFPVEGVEAKKILEDFVEFLENTEISADTWLSTIKNRAHDSFKVARDGAEWKTGNYAMKFAEYAMILRLGMARDSVSPDLYEMIQVLGKDEIIGRIRDNIAKL